MDWIISNWEWMLLGFMVAIPLFLLSYLKAHGTKWRLAIIFAVLTTATIYGVFILALDVNLYQGFLLGLMS